MTVPILSKYARDIGASPALAGLLGSLYGFLQLFSSPAVGRWSDVSGRKHVLLWCLLLSAVGYAMLGAAGSILALFIARLPAGVFKHSQELSRAYLADISPSHQHPRVFGRFNSVSNIGFIIGPVVGGYIADNLGGFNVVAIVTAAIFVLNFSLVYAVHQLVDLPTKPHQASDHTKTMPDNNSVAGGKRNPSRQAVWLSVWDVMLARFLLGMAVLVFRSDFVSVVHHRYGASNTEAGYATSFGSTVGTATGFTVGWVAEWYCNDARRLLYHSALLQTASFLAMIFTPNLLSLALCQAPLAVACAIGRVTSIEVTLVQGGRQFTGELMGAGATVLSVARMLAPTVSGLALEMGDCGPAVVSLTVAAAGTLSLLLTSRRTDIKLHTE